MRKRAPAFGMALSLVFGRRSIELKNSINRMISTCSFVFVNFLTSARRAKHTMPDILQKVSWA